MKEERILCTCKHCKEEFDGYLGDDECYDCVEVITESSNPELLLAICDEFGTAPTEVVEMGEEWEIDGADYLVLTDEEADEKLKEVIKETLWAFNPNFLASCTGFDEVVFKPYGELCEAGNEALLSLVEGSCGLDHLVYEAVMWDGRGHYLSSYDGEEIEVWVGDEVYYLYRT